MRLGPVTAGVSGPSRLASSRPARATRWSDAVPLAVSQNVHEARCAFAPTRESTRYPVRDDQCYHCVIVGLCSSMPGLCAKPGEVVVLEVIKVTLRPVPYRSARRNSATPPPPSKLHQRRCAWEVAKALAPHWGALPLDDLQCAHRVAPTLL